MMVALKIFPCLQTRLMRTFRAQNMPIQILARMTAFPAARSVSGKAMSNV
jgi:hypothetical protein